MGDNMTSISICDDYCHTQCQFLGPSHLRSARVAGRVKRQRQC